MWTGDGTNWLPLPESVVAVRRWSRCLMLLTMSCTWLTLASGRCELFWTWVCCTVPLVSLGVLSHPWPIKLCSIYKRAENRYSPLIPFSQSYPQQYGDLTCNCMNWYCSFQFYRCSAVFAIVRNSCSNDSLSFSISSTCHSFNLHFSVHLSSFPRLFSIFPFNLQLCYFPWFVMLVHARMFVKKIFFTSVLFPRGKLLWLTDWLNTVFVSNCCFECMRV